MTLGMGTRQKGSKSDFRPEKGVELLIRWIIFSDIEIDLVIKEAIAVTP